MTSYEETCEINKVVVSYAIGFQQTEDIRYIWGIHDQLKNITLAEASKVANNAGLGAEILKDMLQEAFLRLPAAVTYYDWYTTPVFISYWRRVIHNHFVTLYQKEWRHTHLEVDPHRRDNSANARLVLQEIEKKFLDTIATWQNQKQVSIAKEVFYTRIFTQKEDQAKQSTIAEKFSITQSQVSHYEKYLRDLISDFKDSLD